MSVDRVAILSQTPHWYVPPFVTPLNVPLDEFAGVVRPAVRDVKWDGGESETLRLIAYALYAAALSEADAAARLLGTDAQLETDIASAIAGLSPYNDGALDELCRAVLQGHRTGEMRVRDPNEGWAVTLLEMVAAARPQVLDALLGRGDPAHFLLRWLLQRWSPNDRLVRYAEVVMRSGEEKWKAAAAFLSVAARAHVERGEDAPTVPGSVCPESHLVVSGIVLTEIYDYGRRSVLKDDARERWETFVGALRQTVAHAASTASAARKLQQVADRDDTSLVALIVGAAPQAASRTFFAAGEALLRKYFRPLRTVDRAADTEALPYLAPLVIEDLAHIWVTIEADDGFFAALRDELRCDEFAYAFTFGHYLTDRPRATVLAAIGAVAAKEMRNEALLEAARALAFELQQLPSIGWATLDAASVESIRERTGIQLPPT